MESMKISLAGDLGSGKSTVGRIIGEKCGLEFYSTGTIQRKIALERGMTTYELNRYMEDHPEIDDEIDNGLKELENSDKNLVIDSRLAWHFVPSSFAVYMTTMSEISARRIMNAKRDSEPFASIDEAIESISLRRASESRRYLSMYGVDIKNMDNYDLVLDTSFVPPEKVADTVLKYYRMAREGTKFDKYVLSPKRIYPLSPKEDGKIAVAERDGDFFLVAGKTQFLSLVKRGVKLVSCQKGEGDFCAEGYRAQLETWEKESGIAFSRVPACLKG